ncbi:MAG: type II toxin-antitoxin system RatA family toxin [Comamonadaceae bacterium]|nr:MAG: type II toxin-antitoxin system RatA family toxin [Comamonadaceae bacterium]
MKTVNKSVLIWYGAQQMYDLVTDVARYPEFLPWCDRTRIVAEDANGMTAEIGLSLGGLRQSFTTRNTHVPGREVQLKLVSGPFSNLDGTWRFTPVEGEAARQVGIADACRIDLDLRYGFDNFALSALVGPVFDKIASTLVEAFVKRAEQVYGGV